MRKIRDKGEIRGMRNKKENRDKGEKQEWEIRDTSKG